MKRIVVVLSVVFISLLSYYIFIYNQTLRPDIVIIGGGFDGCTAARSAAAAAPDKKILLVVNDPVQALGGIGTVGGQNFTDIRYWHNKVVTQGSFGRWYNSAGQFYNTDRMAQIIKEDLSQFPNLTILYSYDVKDVHTEKNLINELTLSSIYRNQNGVVAWGDKTEKIKSKFYIDTTVDGRLTRLSGNVTSVGRADWPEHYLPKEEINTSARQQAATLMFQVTGVTTPPKNMKIKDWEFVRDNKGSWGLAGGKETFRTNPVVTEFNDKYGSLGFATKPINAATNGKDSNIWWVNCLLIFNVDARAHQRDEGSNRAVATLPGQLNIDQARINAWEFLQQPEFIKTLREFKVQDPNSGQWYGFGNAKLVLERNGLPVVGQTMYIRESAHSPLTEKIGSGTENNNYAITTKEAQLAGAGPTDADAQNYTHRIGLGYYMMDINAFIAEDLKIRGGYDWPVTKHLRPDWQEVGGEPTNPVYLPYEALLPAKIENLLVPGYSAGISSFAWAELRVLPNLAVLGDAAGVTAVHSLTVNKPPRHFNDEDIRWVQKKLLQFGARLDK